MFEKVNPSHPDKIADRIAGALVDLAYEIDTNPRIAVEVLIGHWQCHIIAETSVKLPYYEVNAAVHRIAGIDGVNYLEVPQDPHLAENQTEQIRVGDNGIFKGTPTTEEQQALSNFARRLYMQYPYDGKFILAKKELIVCQSNAPTNLDELIKLPGLPPLATTINPLGPWTGGTDVDTGATNRKLGSDMGDAVTGGGLHGKDLSKADVSVNIYAHLLAEKIGTPIKLFCAIGDTTINGKPYTEIVETARNYINKVGGFEKFAEWGLI